MKWLPILAFSLGAGLFLGRWSARPSEAPTSLSPHERRYLELGKDAVAFLNWYYANERDKVEEAALRDNVGILRSKAAGIGFEVQNGIISNPPEESKSE